MKLHLLKRSSGLKDKAKQRGRGNGTGTGNYSGRGLKGQKARSGHSMKAFFEGGQTSIIQRLPKAKGFKRPFKLVKDVAVINLGVLDQDARISDAMELTKTVLKDLGYIKDAKVVVKVLGNGEYGKHIKFVDVELFSKSAQEKIANPMSVPAGDGAGSSRKVMLKSIKEQKKIEKDEKDQREKKIKEDKKNKADQKVEVKKVTAKPLLETGEVRNFVKDVKKVKDVEPKKATAKKPTAKKVSE